MLSVAGSPLAVCALAALSACSSDAPAESVGGAAAPDVSEETIPVEPESSPLVADTLGREPAASEPEVPASDQIPPRGDRCRPTAGNVELLVWHAVGSDSEVRLEELADEYNSLDTGVSVVLERRGNYTETIREYAAAAPEFRPDLLMADHRGLRTLFDSDRFVPPGECFATGEPLYDDMLPVIRAAYSLDGELLAFPFNVSTPVLMFNSAKVEAAGLDPATPPLTLQELSAAARRVVESGAAPAGLVAYDGFGPWFVEQFNARRAQLSGIPDNGRLGSPIREVDFATPEIVASIEWLLGEIEAGRAEWIGGSPSGFEEIVPLALPDGPAYTITTSAAIGDVIRILEGGSFPGGALGVGPMPGPGRGALVGGGAFWLADSGDPERVGAAFAFADWLLEPEQQAAFAGYTGTVPVRTGALGSSVLQEAWTANPELRVAYDQLSPLNGSPTAAGAAWGAGDAVNRVLYEALGDIVTQNLSPVEELRRASDQINDLLEEYNSGIDGS